LIESLNSQAFILVWCIRINKLALLLHPIFESFIKLVERSNYSQVPTLQKTYKAYSEYVTLHSNVHKKYRKGRS
jgi:hypothetical protein